MADRDYDKLAAQYRQEAKEMASGAGKTPSKESQQAAADAAAARKEEKAPTTKTTMGKKKGGCVKMAAGGSASKRADGCAQRGKTRGKVV
jgi:hypothetical protein